MAVVVTEREVPLVSLVTEHVDVGIERGLGEEGSQDQPIDPAVGRQRYRYSEARLRVGEGYSGAGSSSQGAAVRPRQADG